MKIRNAHKIILIVDYYNTMSIASAGQQFLWETNLQAVQRYGFETKCWNLVSEFYLSL